MSIWIAPCEASPIRCLSRKKILTPPLISIDIAHEMRTNIYRQPHTIWETTTKHNKKKTLSVLINLPHSMDSRTQSRFEGEYNCNGVPRCSTHPTKTKQNNSHDSSLVNWLDSLSLWNWFDSSNDSSGYEKCDSIRLMIQEKTIRFWFDSGLKSESFTSLTHIESLRIPNSCPYNRRRRCILRTCSPCTQVVCGTRFPSHTGHQHLSKACTHPLWSRRTHHFRSSVGRGSAHTCLWCCTFLTRTGGSACTSSWTDAYSHSGGWSYRTDTVNNRRRCCTRRRCRPGSCTVRSCPGRRTGNPAAGTARSCLPSSSRPHKDGSCCIPGSPRPAATHEKRHGENADNWKLRTACEDTGRCL